MNLPDVLYAILICLLPVWWMLGCFFFCFSEIQQELPSKFKLFRLNFPILIGSGSVSWILMAFLVINLPQFNWVSAILSPLLLVVTGISLWQLAKSHRRLLKDKKPGTGLIIPFVTSSLALAFLMLLQFLFRYSSLIS